MNYFDWAGSVEWVSRCVIICTVGLSVALKFDAALISLVRQNGWNL